MEVIVENVKYLIYFDNGTVVFTCNSYGEIDFPARKFRPDQFLYVVFPHRQSSRQASRDFEKPVIHGAQIRESGDPFLGDFSPPISCHARNHGKPRPSEVIAPQ